MLIRPARPDEASFLAALAVRSKAHWPYSTDFIARFARTLGLTPEVVAANDVWVAERAGQPDGFYTLLHRGEFAVLDDLWIEPGEIGRGLGRRLFEHARDRASGAGAHSLEWEAEPHATVFYERMGGHQTRWVDSSLGRRLPVMALVLAGSRPVAAACGSH
ncbi:MAG: GNAT family N-acetyltransferase [Pseudonocardia sp.]